MTQPLRTPLYEVERLAEPTTVCVTGVTGYVASAIVKRLLVAGHTVHGTCRNPDDSSKVAFLQALPMAGQHLKLFKAELREKGSFDAAVVGCKYVIHVASPVALHVPAAQAQERLIKPAVEGVENIISAINSAGCVHRLVLTSSIAAVYGDKHERGPGHVFSEEDWNIAGKEDYLPYSRSKAEAEKRAWELCKQQPADAKQKWTLVALNPVIVIGPPVGNIKCESVGFMRQLMNGSYWPFAMGVSLEFVDVDDVAAAHALAMLKPEAKGRYILSAHSVSLSDFVQLLRPEYSRHWLPWLPVPYWFIWLVVKMNPRLVDIDVVRANWGRPAAVDTSKAKGDLGLKYRDLRSTAQDMAASLIELGVVKKC